MANRYPISAITGSAEVMKLMEEIFYSRTYGGEALSLAAALATMRKLNTQPVIQRILESGQRLKSGIQRRIKHHEVDHIIGISGHPAWTFILFKDVAGYTDRQIQTLFVQEMLAHGILTFGIQFVSYAHTESEIDRLLAAYDEFLPILKDAVDNRCLDRRLRCEPLEPLFRLAIRTRSDLDSWMDERLHASLVACSDVEPKWLMQMDIVRGDEQRANKR